MSVSTSHVQLVILDACCVINLWATGRPAEILSGLPYRFAIARYVAEHEVLTLRAEKESGTAGMPTAIDLGIEGIALEILEKNESLEVDFVRFAGSLDDGEAWTCAHAVATKAWVATDDRKALRILREQDPPIRAIQTPELLREWTLGSTLSQSEIREILRAIEVRARFRPRRDAALRSWWLGSSR